MAETRVGSTIGKRYTVIEKLGEGGMSVVWLARDQRLQRLQAIKEIKNNASDAIHRADVDLMRKEAHIMKDLDHPNIVHVHDIIDENDALYVVMDYVPGKDLNKVMRENRERLHVTHFAYPQDDVIDWGKQLCSALGYLHQQNPPIIYRDMKPGNVMLQDDGQVKIIDFGIAREFKPDQNLDTTQLGTRGYASPEAVEKASQTDARSDVYSLGVTLFHLVTGHSPLEYVKQPNLPPIREVNPSLSPALEAIIIKATRWDPNMRQQSMAELELELELLEDNAAQLWMRRTFNTFKGLVIAALAAVLVGVGCIVGSQVVRGQSYAGLIEQAERSSKEERNGEESAAEEAYRQAIELNPRRIDPYMKLVKEVYADDNVFSRTEESRWNHLFRKYQGDIADDSEYPELCYEAGFDYMFRMETTAKDDTRKGSEEWDVAQDELERGQRAASWFEEAIRAWDERGEGDSPERATANAYLFLGKFDTLMSNARISGEFEWDGVNLTQGEAYRKYFDTLSQTVNEIHGQNVWAIVELRLYHIAARTWAANSFVSSFKNATPKVTKKEMTNFVEQVRKNTQDLQDVASGDPTLQAIYESILDACDHAYPPATSGEKGTIEKVYGAADRLEQLVNEGASS